MSYYWRQFEHNSVQIESDQDGTSLSVQYPDGWVWRAYYPELIWDGGDYGNGPFTVEARSATANGNLERCAKMLETLIGEIVSAVPYEPRLTTDSPATSDKWDWESDLFDAEEPEVDEWYEENPWDYEVKKTIAFRDLDGVDVITPLRDDKGNLIGLEVIPSEDHVSTSDSCKTLARWFDVDVSVYPGTYANG